MQKHKKIITRRQEVPKQYPPYILNYLKELKNEGIGIYKTNRIKTIIKERYPGLGIRHINTLIKGVDKNLPLITTRRIGRFTEVRVLAAKVNSQKSDRKERNLASYKVTYWGMMLSDTIDEASAKTRLDKSLFKEFNQLTRREQRRRLEALRNEALQLDLAR